MTTGMQEPEDGEEAVVGTAESSAPQEGVGGISVGVLTGGAVAAGSGATAEDRSRRAGLPAPVPPSYESGRPPVVPPAVPGGIRIGVMAGGAAASGPHARALDASTQLIDASPELLAAVGTLREQLHLLSPSDETTEVDAQLAEVEEEIDAVGQVGRGRLQRLRERLDLGATAAAGLASAAAVVQQITQLLGSQG
ncbi:hypothetical protein QOM21_34390 [Streptomyces sp. Pv4-95]|uniref:hypothetical protein n=1 Tax=Streptomyces sp. Pv4-95 TaxID=3049543 RepID=UPI003891D62E